MYPAWDWATSRMGLVNPPWEDGVPSVGLGDFQDGFV